MRPLQIDEIDRVYGGTDFEDRVYDWQVATFLWQLGLIGSQGTSSEQPVPPPWWGECGSPQYQSYLTNGGLGTTCP